MDRTRRHDLRHPGLLRPGRSGDQDHGLPEGLPPALSVVPQSRIATLRHPAVVAEPEVHRHGSVRPVPRRAVPTGAISPRAGPRPSQPSAADGGASGRPPAGARRRPSAHPGRLGQVRRLRPVRRAMPRRRALHVGQAIHRLRGGRPGASRQAVLREVRRRRHHLGRGAPLAARIHAGPVEGAQGAGHTHRARHHRLRVLGRHREGAPLRRPVPARSQEHGQPRAQGRRGGPQRADPRERPQDRGRGRQDADPDPRDPQVQRLRGGLQGGWQVCARSSARR